MISMMALHAKGFTMDQINDIDYYRRREATARHMADGSSDKAIRRIHTDMAEGYAAKVRDLTPKPRLVFI